MALKDEVLQVLEEKRGESVSGEILANSLHLSRTAIWKAITQLREDGHSISAVRNKGYCLQDESDMLTKQGLLVHLDEMGLEDKITVLKTTTSTNLDAKRLALEGAEEKSIVFANEQTAGRGRMGRSFYSPSGQGIYMSMILKPKMTGEDALLITTAVSVAVSRAIERVTEKKCQIKWVNDIYLDNRKICGISTEAITDFESGGIDFVVLGIGINFLGDVKKLPEEIQNKAGYLYSEKPSNVTRNRLATEVVKEVFKIIDNLKAEKFIEEYRSKSFIIGSEIDVIKGDTIELATALDIDNRGGLIVKMSDGEMRTISTGEVSIRKRG